MVFLFGANLPEQKVVRFALRNVFGIGKFKAESICNSVGIHPSCKVNELNESQVSSIARLIESDPDKCGHELQRKIAQRILHFHTIKSRRGDRLIRGLPANGQQSHSNGNTAKKRLGQFISLRPHP